MTASSHYTASLCDDQRARWGRGESVRVEDYLSAEPALANDADAVLDLIIQEWRLREERGDVLELAEYEARFDSLRDRLPALLKPALTRVMDSSSNGAGDDALRLFRPQPMPKVAGYEMIAELGRGGMGIVFEAKQTSLQRTVALKMILAGPCADDKVRKRFRTEAEAVARLRHPNIVQIHEIGEHEGNPYLCLEYVDGGGLDRKKLPMPQREATALVETLARAVHSMHEHSIVHRDLKPNNILLTKDGVPKITDFGLAKLLDADVGQTRTEQFLGTPNYMSPEQATGGAKRVGVPADIYSLGAIYYELLTGQPPFKGTSALNTLEQVRTLEPERPRRRCDWLSADLETICLKCLEKDPAKRYASAAALADDLHRFLAGDAIAARRTPLWERAWRYARKRPARFAWTVCAIALIGTAVAAGVQFRGAREMTQHRAVENYRKFAQLRDEAYFRGLIAGDDAPRFFGADFGANRLAATEAARTALELVGVNLQSSAAIGQLKVPPARSAEAMADCSALLLMLADSLASKAGGVAASDQSAREALRFLALVPNQSLSRVFLLQRANVLERLGQSDAAALDRKQAAATPVSEAANQFAKGEEDFRNDDGPKAAAHFNRTLALEPNHFWARFLLALCHLKTGQNETARAELSGCLSQREFVWAYLFRSFANERLGALDESKADFDRAWQLDPQPDARYVLVQMRGIFAFQQRDYVRAADDFRAAIDLKPRFYNGYLNLAHAYQAEGRLDLAENQFQAALELDPPPVVVFGYYLERARKLVNDHEYEAAIAACAEARKAKSDDPAPFQVLGIAQLHLGDYERAERSLDRFANSKSPLNVDFFRARGQVRMKLGKFAEAAEDYSRALELVANADTFEHRGWAYFFADASKLALRDFAKALELDASRGDTFTGKALAQVMLGDYRQAVADADAALKFEPMRPEMLHNLACVFAQAAARVEADSAERAGATLAENYRDRAFVQLRRALDNVPENTRTEFWRTKVVPDAALAPIRGDSRFAVMGRLLNRS